MTNFDTETTTRQTTALESIASELTTIREILAVLLSNILENQKKEKNKDND